MRIEVAVEVQKKAKKEEVEASKDKGLIGRKRETKLRVYVEVLKSLEKVGDCSKRRCINGIISFIKGDYYLYW